MKVFWILIVAIITTAGIAHADEAPPKHSHADNFSIGFEYSDSAGDFGLGLQLTSPTFAEVLAIRLGGGVAFFEEGVVDGGESISYSPYYTARLGLMVSAGWPTENIRAYSVSGLLTVIPNSDLSTESVVLGGYGIIGFDFFMAPDSGWSYFIEGSALGTGASADKLVGDPIYQNGFRAAAGVRCAL